MKLTTFLLIVTLLQVSARAFTQSVNLNEHNVPVERVLQSIEKQTGYVFFFDYADLKNISVSVDVKNASIDEALNTCFKGLPLTFKIVNKDIVVARKEESVLKKIGDFFALPIKVTGKVTDEYDNVLPGATVKIKGYGNFTTSGKDGRFTLVLPDSKETVLVFSFIGFKTKEIAISKTTDNLVIKLEQDPGNLDEIKVIAYGTTTRRDATGAIDGVNAPTLDKMPLNDPLLELEGRVPGLQITPSSGLPGSAPSVLIRGVNSLNRSPGTGFGIDPSNSPLYVLDGVPFVSSPLNAQGVYANMGVYNSASGLLMQSSPFKSINPEDIESIEVLKDADATAIYGARGANGVILITTKRPKAGNTKFDINVYDGVGKVPHFMHMLNTQQYLAVRKEAFKNDGLTPSSNPNDFVQYAPDLTLWDQNAYTNWQKKYAGGNATTTNVETTLQGGNEQTRILLNTGYRQQGNVFPGDYGLQQGSARLNVDHNSLDKKFTINISTSYSTDLNKLLSSDPYSYYDLPPNQPIYNASGGLDFSAGKNPLAGFLQTYQDRTKNLNSNIIIGYQIFKNLHFRTSFGYSRIQQDQVKELPQESYDPTSSGNGRERDQATNLSATYIVEPQLDYSLKIGKGNLQALLGGSYQGTSASSLFLQGRNYTNDDLLGDIASASNFIVQTSASDYKYESVFARLNYKWDNKYILNLTGRRDGSSRFGPNKRFGDFGAAGAAWIFNEEPWMKQLNFLSFGKLRGSYGITGNDNIGDYQYYSTYKANSNAVYQTVGYVPSGLYNPDYQWETNKKLELAVELGFFKDRLFLVADYYRNTTGNSLVSYPLPTQTGFPGVTENLNAKIQNTGFELSLNTVNIQSKDLTWKTSFNMSLQRNKLLSFPGLSGSPYRNQYVIGQSISNTVGFVYAGVDPKTGAATFKDLNHNGQTMEYGVPPYGDQAVISNNLPDFYGGFTNTFVYKNWELALFFNFRKLDKVGYPVNFVPGFGLRNIDNSTGGRWQTPGDITNTPRYLAGFNTALGAALLLNQSTYDLRNGSFVKLSNAALSYSFPESIAKSIGFNNLRLFMDAQNLFAITNYPGPDPETGLSMPALRTIVVGAKITL